MHTSESLCELWHKRMKHLHHRALPLLRQMVTRLPVFNLDHHGVCKGYAWQECQGTFSSSETLSKGILDLIHSDVGVPMSAASVKGASYYVTFIDDFSRKTWIYFMKTKDEVCYPPFLGITKDDVSGPRVADMEYQEIDQEVEPHHTTHHHEIDGCIIHHTSLAHIETTCLAP
jgi:hypothetical protein